MQISIFYTNLQLICLCMIKGSKNLIKNFKLKETNNEI